MTDPRAQRLERLAQLVDGQLSASERAALEREIAESPEARAQLEVLRRIDASLASTFAAAATEAPLAPRALRASPVPTFRRVAIGSIAAALLLLITGWFLWPAGQWPKPSARPTTVDALLDQYVDAGFRPEFRCENDEQFKTFTHDRLGVGLLAANEPGVELLGWGYPRDVADMGLAEGTVSLFARVDGTDVLVLMTPSGREAHPRAQWLRGHNVFRQELAGVLLIEVSPLGEARILPLFQTVPCPELREDHPADGAHP